MNIETIIKQQANLGDKYLDDYLQLVTDVVNGKVKESHADRVAKVLDNAKKTVDDLSSDVMLCRQRRQWKSQLDEVPNIEEDIATEPGGETVRQAGKSESASNSAGGC